MDKKQKLVLIIGFSVVAILIAVLAVMIFRETTGSGDDEKIAALEQVDSLQLANDQLVLTSQFDQINAEFSQYEDQQVYLKNDSLVQQYNQSRERIKELLAELDREKRNGKRNQAASQARIKELEAEIGTLKGIVKHYIEEINRLGKENEGLRTELAQANERNQSLASVASEAQASNARLQQTVNLAKKLNVTGLTLRAYNKKDKAEKKINKAAKLGVHFIIAPNNTASPGMKDVYVRVTTPEGKLLGGAQSFTYDGASLAASAHRRVEYGNDEQSVQIYLPVTATLTSGAYNVEVFCDGYRLASRNFEMQK